MPSSSSPGANEGEADLETLRSKWKTLYSQTLPSLARAKDAAQPKWPVTLDHCFARIILDNTLGAQGSNDVSDSGVEDTSGTSGQADDAQVELVPWDTVISRPAVRNMDAAQLRAAIALGERIVGGEVDLVELDRRSLVGRGKSEGKYGNDSGSGSRPGRQTVGGKRKRDNASKDKSPEGKTTKAKSNGDTKKRQSVLAFKTSGESNDTSRRTDESVEAPGNDNRSSQSDSTTSKHTRQLERALDTKSTISKEEAMKTLKRIDNDNSLTQFRKNLYTSLLSVPRGQYTTYAALASHLNSVARAVGNGMRNNPFAPDVPCHRVLASDGSIGGFGGDWSRDGKITEKQSKKMDLLKEEGVRFDSTGKVKGQTWTGFWDKEDFVREFGGT